MMGESIGSGLSKGFSTGTQFAHEIALKRAGLKQEKQLEKQKMIETGIGSIKEMRQLIPSLGPSNFIGGLFPGETASNRSKFEQLGRSLIPLVATGVSIRNQKEFDEYKKKITNPNAKQSDIEGALDGVENILMRQHTGGNLTSEEKEESPIEKISSKSEVSEGKILDEKTMHKFLQQTTGTRKERIIKAQALARKAGYKIT
jgi:hypothetical protein